MQPRRRPPSLLLAAIAAALLLCAPPAAATSYVMVDDAELLQQADAVVDARVIAVEPAPVSGRPATDVHIEIERLLAGSAPGTSLIVRLPGGVRPDGIGFHAYGAPTLSTGDRAVLFLVPRDDGTFGVLHLMLGAFHRVQLAGSPPLAARNLAEATEVVPADREPDPQRHLPRDYDAFTQWLADRGAGIEREPDYFVTDSTVGRLFERFGLFSQGGLNLRWFDFDTGGAVSWFLHRKGQAGIDDGGVSAFKRALAAWGRDSQTPIRLEFAGRSEATGGLQDGAFDRLNVLLPNDPEDEIEGSFQCSGGGTLAMGGPWFDTNNPGVFRGRTFHRIIGADIVMNDGIECLKSRTSCFPVDIEEIYGHELGHTLGLGHSCGDDTSPSCASDPALGEALMTAFAHSGCRGARLASDDLAGARFLYRPPGAGSRGPAAPVGLEAELRAGAVVLSWEDRSTDEDGFRVERAEGGGAFATVGEASAEFEEFEDRSVRPATTYRYRVASFNDRGSTPSASVEIVLPPVVPLTAAIVDEPAREVRVGEPIDLRTLITGPAEEAEWSFGDGAVGFNETRCAPDAFCRTHIFSTAGSHAVEVTVRGPFGQAVSDRTTVEVADAPFEPAVEESVLEWTLFGARGNTGTFESNVWLHNAGEDAALVELTFFPRGNLPRSDPRTLTVAPSESIFLPNVLEKVFAISSDQGSIGLRTLVPAGSEPRVRVISRAFVNLPNPAEGSFGQFVGGRSEDDWSAADRVATGILNGDGFIATLLAANVDDRAGRVEMTLTDRDGLPVGDPATFGLGAKGMRFRPLTDLFPEAADRPGPFTVQFSSNGIRFVASSTLLETGSEDQIFIPAEEPDEATELLLPRAVRSPGQFGVFLTTAVSVLNRATVPTELTFELLERGQDNSDPPTATRTVPAGEVLYLEDVIADLFDLETGTGALRVLWDNTQGIGPRVVGMTLSENPLGERFGMLVASRTPAEAVTERGVDFGAEQSSLFRSQYGVASLHGARTTLRLTLRDGNGKDLDEATRHLKPRQHLELNLSTIFDGASAGRNWSVSTEVLEGGPVTTYLANINKSGDVFLVPGRNLR